MASRPCATIRSTTYGTVEPDPIPMTCASAGMKIPSVRCTHLVLKADVSVHRREGREPLGRLDSRQDRQRNRSGQLFSGRHGLTGLDELHVSARTRAQIFNESVNVKRREVVVVIQRDREGRQRQDDVRSDLRGPWVERLVRPRKSSVDGQLGKAWWMPVCEMRYGAIRGSAGWMG